jgi:hypothetical protein
MGSRTGSKRTLLAAIIFLSLIGMSSQRTSGPLSTDQLTQLGYKQVVKTRKICSLWAGYGSIDEVVVVPDDESNGKRTTLIVKNVSPPSAGRQSDIGHMRKVKSYEVEASFYKSISADLRENKKIAIPQALLVHTAREHHESASKGLTLVMNDLKADFPITPPDELVEVQIEAGLKWLARFHAAFWERRTPEFVWEQGGYWHLRTRMEEWSNMGECV